MTGPASIREDLRVVARQIHAGSRVLDLGCGDGELLNWLIRHRGCTGTGVERKPSAVLAAMAHGVPVIDADIDRDLELFAADSYDVAVVSRTLQATLRPDLVLLELRRITPRVILTMPNFGLLRHRLRLLTGHMPQSRDLPYSWYASPNLHFTTLHDLEPLFFDTGFRIERRIPLTPSGRPLPLGQIAANLLASAAIYVLVRDDQDPQAHPTASPRAASSLRIGPRIE